jgi:hypothetical protein
VEQDEIWDADTAAHYDTPGEGMFAPEVLGPTVDRLTELAGVAACSSSRSAQGGWPFRWLDPALSRCGASGCSR